MESCQIEIAKILQTFNRATIWTITQGRGYPTRQILLIVVVAISYWVASAYTQGPFEYVSPHPDVEIVSAGTTIAVRHEDIMDESSLPDSLFGVVGSQSATHAGQVILADDQKTVNFEPEAPFTPSETVTPTILTDFTALVGETLDGPAYAQGPFEYVSPRPDAEFVSAGTTIAVRHGDIMDESSLSDSLFNVVGSQSGTHAGQVILADDQKTVIFEPEAPFTPSETVTATIQTGLMTLAGETLDGLSYTFAMSSKPLLESIQQSVAADDAYDLSNKNPSNEGGTGVFSHTIPNYATLPNDFPVITITVPANNTGQGHLFLSNFSRQPPSFTC